MSNVSAAPLEAQYAVAVAKKAIDAQQVQAKNALRLIETATAPPLKPGHVLSVIA